MQVFTPMEYLLIDIANNFGLDKENWNTRIEWTKENDHKLEDLMPMAEEPAMFYAGVQALRKAQKGEAIAYPISLDATASGAQLLAIMIGCEKSASLCNVVNTGKREDLYTDVYQLMCDVIGSESKISRSDVKDAIMPSFYGSTAAPKRVFGEGKLLSVYKAVMQQEAPGIWKLNQNFLDMWDSEALSHDWVMPDNFHVHIKVMGHEYEGFHFDGMPEQCINKVNMPTEEGRSLGANVTHALDGMVVREMTRRCAYDSEQVQHVQGLCEAHLKAAYAEAEVMENSHNSRMVKTLVQNYQESGFMSARIIDHIDIYSVAYLGTKEAEAVLDLIGSLPKKPFNVLSVHDCFRVLPSYGNDLRRQYNQILSELAGSNILKFILDRLLNANVNVVKYSNFADKVLQADYALS